MCDRQGILSDNELRFIAKLLAEEPSSGIPSQEVPNLRHLSWPLGDKSSSAKLIWYLADSQVPHIEVIAITSKNDPPSKQVSVAEVFWKALRIGMILRTLYKGLEVVSNHFHLG